MELSQKRMTLLLRIAIAFAFLYPPYDAIANPYSWLSYFPQFLQNTATANELLLVWGILEVIIALWILSGIKIFIPSVVAAIFLCLIVVFNLPVMEIVFRDISLALVAATLAWWSYRS
ncbi:MAG TPA: hypothetical protein VN665_03405 [Candidatus Paceibacterota bacterium]|nr:hypothetical protein [Candidatus Paceibacterota bacterium]